MSVPAPRLKVVLFGRPRFCVDGVPVALGVTQRTIALLSYVALAGEAGVDREHLAATFWPDMRATDARADLRRHLYYLAKAFEGRGLSADVIERAGHGPIRLDARLAWVDAVAFEAAMRDGAFATAIDLYTADLLESGVDEEWVEPARLRLRERYGRALDGAIADARARGDDARAIAAAQRGLAVDPYHEGLVCTLMRLQHRSGDRRGVEATYRRFVGLLADDVGAEPLPQTRATYEELCASRERGTTALPPETASFVGREREIERISELVGRMRAVAISGPPGVGKTRLALRAASAVGACFDDGAFVVALAHVAGPRAVERAIVSALGAMASRNDDEAERSIEDVASGKAILLVLDNCEHVKEEAAVALERLLRASPRLAVIATSREVLRVPNVALIRLAPLDTPGADATDAEAARSPAVRLFFERIARAHGGVPTAHEVAAVVRSLDGLPLAIELAAARMRAMSFADLAATLQRRTALLADGEAPPRARSLAAAFTWSYELLADDERRLLLRSSVFRGGFTAAAAAAVCRLAERDEWTAFDALGRLADASLLVPPVEGDPQPRYALLSSIRDCAFERLRADGAHDDARLAHASYYATRYVARNDDLRGARAHEAYPELDRERENLRAALSFLIGERRDVALGLRLALALSRFWFDRGLVDEGEEWFERGLAAQEGDPSLRARALSCLATITRNRRGYARTRDLTADAVALLRSAASDGVTLGKALLTLSNCERVLGRFSQARAAADDARRVLAPSGDSYLRGYIALTGACTALVEGRLDEARAELREALHLYEETGARADAALVLNNLALCEYHAQAPDAAAILAEEALRLSREAGNRFCGAHALHTLALVERARGSDRCTALAAEALDIAREYADKDLLVSCIEFAAAIAVDADHATDGTALLGAADAARDRFDAPRPPVEANAVSMLARRADARLGTAASEAARRAGSALGLAVAGDRALAILRTGRRFPDDPPATLPSVSAPGHEMRAVVRSRDVVPK